MTRLDLNLWIEDRWKQKGCFGRPLKSRQEWWWSRHTNYFILNVSITQIAIAFPSPMCLPPGCCTTPNSLCHWDSTVFQGSRRETPSPIPWDPDTKLQVTCAGNEQAISYVYLSSLTHTAHSRALQGLVQHFTVAPTKVSWLLSACVSNELNGLSCFKYHKIHLFLNISIRNQLVVALLPHTELCRWYNL